MKQQQQKKTQSTNNNKKKKKKQKCQQQWILMVLLLLSVISTLIYNASITSRRQQLENWFHIEDGIPRKRKRTTKRQQRKQILRKELQRHDNNNNNNNKRKRLKQRKPSTRKYKTAQEIVAQMANNDALKEEEEEEEERIFSWWTTKETTSTSSSSSLKQLQQLQVGHVGDAVHRAKQYGFINRMKGFSNRQDWNIIGTDICLDQGEPAYIDNNNNNNSTTYHNKNNFPHAILIGVQKGGTTALYSYLDQHPNIIHSQKELYFLDEQIDQLLLKRSTFNQSIGIPRKDARVAYSLTMKQSVLDTQKKKKKQRSSTTRRNNNNNNNNDDEDGYNKNNNNVDNNDDTNMIRLDLTPHYIYLSDRVPQRILCIVPWVKLFALLRNPIDRALSNYNMKLRNSNIPPPTRKGSDSRDDRGRRDDGRDRDSSSKKKKKKNIYGNDIPTFDEYIRMDIEALYETGVLQDWNHIDFNTFSGSEQQFQAWQAYINSGLNAPVGMGLYSIMIQHLFQQFHNYGKNISTDFLAIQSEQLQHDTDITYGRVLDFLNLPKISLKHYPTKNAASEQQKKSTIRQMSPETEELLRTIYEPFNRELGTLLGKEWESVWL